jgi:hypothetical protein
MRLHFLMQSLTLSRSCTSTLAEDVKGIKERVREVLDTVSAMKPQQTAQEQVLQETRRTLTILFKLMKDSGELQPQIDRLIDLANDIWTSTLHNPEALVELKSSQSSSGLPLTWLEELVHLEDAKGEHMCIDSDDSSTQSSSIGSAPQECDKENMGSPKRETASRPLRKISPLPKKRPLLPQRG